MVNSFPKVQEGGLCGEKGDGKQQLWSVNFAAADDNTSLLCTMYLQGM